MTLRPDQINFMVVGIAAPIFNAGQMNYNIYWAGFVFIFSKKQKKIFINAIIVKSRSSLI